MKIKHIRTHKDVELAYGQRKRVINEKGGITIVSDMYVIEDCAVCNYSISLCNPKDVFDKKYGTLLAKARLKDSDTMLRGTIYCYNFYTGHLLKDYLLYDVLHKVKLPKWASDAIIQELRKEWY